MLRRLFSTASSKSCDCLGTVREHRIQAIVGSAINHQNWPSAISSLTNEPATLLAKSLKPSASTVVNAADTTHAQSFIQPGEILLLPAGVKLSQTNNRTIQQVDNNYTTWHVTIIFIPRPFVLINSNYSNHFLWLLFSIFLCSSLRIWMIGTTRSGEVRGNLFHRNIFPPIWPILQFPHNFHIDIFLQPFLRPIIEILCRIFGIQFLVYFSSVVTLSATVDAVISARQLLTD